jgi:hypothetical protein
MYGYNQWFGYKAATAEMMNVEQKLCEVSSLEGGLDQYTGPALRGTGAGVQTLQL